MEQCSRDNVGADESSISLHRRDMGVAVVGRVGLVGGKADLMIRIKGVKEDWMGARLFRIIPKQANTKAIVLVDLVVHGISRDISVSVVLQENVNE